MYSQYAAKYQNTFCSVLHSQIALNPPSQQKKFLRAVRVQVTASSRISSRPSCASSRIAATSGATTTWRSEPFHACPGGELFSCTAASVSPFSGGRKINLAALSSKTRRPEPHLSRDARESLAQHPWASEPRSGLGLARPRGSSCPGRPMARPRPGGCRARTPRAAVRLPDTLGHTDTAEKGQNLADAT